MRYVPIAKLEDGMVLGENMYDGEGRLMLAKHLILNNEYITNLDHLGFAGAYIEDEFSEDIVINPVVRPEVKQEALRFIHELYLEERKEVTAETQQQLQTVVVQVVEDVMNNRDVMFNMMNLRSYDDYTYFHSVNVAILAAMIGASCDMSEYELNILTTAAMLHDIGKRFLEIDILNAKRSLTEEEKVIVAQHPKFGYEFLRDEFDFSSFVQVSVLQHHEWYNGEGYPMRKSGDEIPIYARVIKLVDVYDAMTSKRPYHDAIQPSEAVEYIMAMSGVEFDPELVEVFLKKIAVYPVGCDVQLSDGRTAIVMENYHEFVLRPKVKLYENGQIIDLKSDEDARNLTITKMLM